MKFTNQSNIGLSLAVFLANDNYDFDPRDTSISTTGLLKSTRQIVLDRRIQERNLEMDISSLIPSTYGNALHDGIEKAWSQGRHIKAMKRLGIPEKVIDRVVINYGYHEDPITGEMVKDPNADPLPTNAIPIYMEIRTEKEIDGYTISGKFDFVGDGKLEDHKSTGVYTYMNQGDNIEKFRIQGSIYRWLNPEIITSPRMHINFIFTDWSKLRSIIEAKKGYPSGRMVSLPLDLWSIEKTEIFIKQKIAAIKNAINKDELSLPLCTKEELWQGDTVYKYYKDPNSKTRSTKNFDNFAEAQQRLIKDGNQGVIDIVPGKAKRCEYCSGITICSQAKQLVVDGLLETDLI